MEESPGHSAPEERQPLSVSPALLGKMKSLTANQICDLVVEGLASLGRGTRGDSFVSAITGIMFNLFEQKEFVDVIAILDKLYTWVACKKGITSNPRSFIQLSLEAMKRLEDNNKVNLVFKFCQGLAQDRPDKSGPLIPIHRMPFGLMQYCMEFFTCTNVMQIKEPEDFRLWHETMVTEFPERMQRLLAGPMWSGLDPQDMRDPLKVIWV